MAMLVFFTAAWSGNHTMLPPLPPPPPALGQEALHDSSLRCAKKTRALLDFEEQVNREGS